MPRPVMSSAILAATLAVTAVLAAPAQAQTATELWRTGGFTMPESAFYAAGIDRIVVSSIGVFGPDGGMDGTLSLLTPDGAIENAAWVTGLMDPKGMTAAGDKLFVVDAMGLHQIDMATGTLDATVDLDGTLFPNDATAGPDGTIYVTAFFAGGVWAVRDGAATFVLPPGGAPLPNGILWHDGALILGSFGDVMNPDFTVANPGGLQTLDPATGAVADIAGTAGTGSVYGIVALGGMLVYSDNPTGRIYGAQGGTATVVAEVGAGAADLGVMGNVVLVPILNTGEVVALLIE